MTRHLISDWLWLDGFNEMDFIQILRDAEVIFALNSHMQTNIHLDSSANFECNLDLNGF